MKQILILAIVFTFNSFFITPVMAQEDVEIVPTLYTDESSDPTNVAAIGSWWSRTKNNFSSIFRRSPVKTVQKAPPAAPAPQIRTTSTSGGSSWWSRTKINLSSMFKQIKIAQPAPTAPQITTTKSVSLWGKVVNVIKREPKAPAGVESRLKTTSKDKNLERLENIEIKDIELERLEETII
ncbi:MAG: hypothetical protein KAR54_01350 [Candidatus Pacebacteria bacterium]|nr:hypothetical protein [Candidatus Paceibacterota bacterium]